MQNKDNDTYKMITVYGRYSDIDLHGTTRVRAYVSGSCAIITPAQERAALRRIQAIGGDSLESEDYAITVDG